MVEELSVEYKSAVPGCGENLNIRRSTDLARNLSKYDFSEGITRKRESKTQNVTKGFFGGCRQA